MVRGQITKANMSLLRACRGARRGESEISKFSGAVQIASESSGHEGVTKNRSEKIEESEGCWVPHPRSGIYFPKGHEWVMDDVPDDAARFTQTHWFRNVDGVDHL